MPLPLVKTLAEWDFLQMYPHVRRAWNASKENPTWLMASHSRMKHAYEEIEAKMKNDPTLKDVVVPDYLFQEEMFQFSSFFPQLETQCMERYAELGRNEYQNMVIAAEDLRDSLRASQDDKLTPVQSAGQLSPPHQSITNVCENAAPTSMALPTAVDALPVKRINTGGCANNHGHANDCVSSANVPVYHADEYADGCASDSCARRARADVFRQRTAHCGECADGS